jgi:hypothetical protein
MHVTQKNSSEGCMETAALRLGLAGFNDREQDVVRAAVARFRPSRWLCGGMDGADAWLINGARIARMQGSQLRVIDVDAARQASAILLDAGSRPSAVAVASPGQVHADTQLLFDLRKPETLMPVLAEFDRRLHPAKVRYWTAAHLVEHNATVGKAIFELRAGAELLAVADMKGEVAIFPDASEASFDRAAWKHRARRTVTVPPAFERHSLAQLMWQYTTRTARDLLPERYREGAIFFRRAPRIDPQLIEDLHLRVMRELALGPLSLDELQAGLGAGREAVCRAVAALYYVGSITSNPERASQVSGRGGLWTTKSALLDADRPRPAGQGAGADTRPSTAPLL